MALRLRTPGEAMTLRSQLSGQADLKNVFMACSPLSPPDLRRRTSRASPGRSSPASLPVTAATALSSHGANSLSGTTGSSRGSSLVAQAAVVEVEFSNLERPGPAKATGEETQKAKEQFVWQETWYPICIVRDLDKRIPEPVTILGLPMVLWWDRNAPPLSTADGPQKEGERGQWRVFHDLCPHRLAPLSEGRIHESGDLQCSYHGWTFQGQDGACTMIPQAPKDGPPVNTSPKACARAYPAREHQGLLWVWPQLGPKAAALADATPLPTVPQKNDPSFSISDGQCDLGYSYEYLVENLSDPAHVPFAHHRIMGDRNKATPLEFVVEKLALDGIAGGGTQFRDFRFQPPCLINTTIVIPPKASKDGQKEGDAKKEEVEKQLSMSFYCIPTSPGRSRVVFSFAFNFLPPIAKIIPRWYSHWGQMMVLDSDHYFLHLLERRLQEEGGESKALSAYYAPTRSDAFVLAFRRWLKEYAGSSVQWPEGVDTKLPPVQTKRQLMDRQQNHVSICQSCKRALRWFGPLQLALKAVSFALLAAAALLPVFRPGKVPATVSIATVVLSMVFAGAAAWFQRFLDRTYHFQDYVHALVD